MYKILVFLLCFKTGNQGLTVAVSVKIYDRRNKPINQPIRRTLFPNILTFYIILNHFDILNRC